MVENLEINIERDTVEVTLKPRRPSKAILLSLSLLVMGCFTFPLSILFIEQLEIGFGYILTIVIFWGTAAYFMRKLLWGFRGKEIFIITRNKIRHFFDYGLFNDGTNDFKFKQLKVGYIEEESRNQISLVSERELPEYSLCYLVLIADDQVVKSHTSTSFENIKKLSKTLEK